MSRKYWYIYHQFGDETHKFDKKFETTQEAHDYGVQQGKMFRILTDLKVKPKPTDKLKSW